MSRHLSSRKASKRVVTTSIETGTRLPSIPTYDIDNGQSMTSIETMTRLQVKTKGGRYHNLIQVVVPKHCRTDKASVPFPMSMLYSNAGRQSRAAICHDLLYRDGFIPITRKAADRVFYDIMVCDNVRVTKAFVFWFAVRLFGWTSFANRHYSS